MQDISGSAGYWIQQLLNGIFLASLYAVLATAYALLQGITNRIILSFGDVSTFGAFAAVSMATWGFLQGSSGAAVLFTALGVAVLATAALGQATHSSVFGPLIRSTGQAVMIASIGLSILLQEGLRINSGARDRWLPPLFESGVTLLEGDFPVNVGLTQLGTAAVAWSAVGLMHLVMRRTRAGRMWRAVAGNPRLAELSGVDTSAVLRWTFLAASGFAGLAGAMIAVVYGGVGFSMGLVLGFKAMFAAIIGGFGRLGGAVAGAVFLAGIEVMWTAQFPAAYRDVVVFGIIIMVLILKPEGLLGDADTGEKV
jgi:branched-chain amino acid transport system permease protein